MRVSARSALSAVIMALSLRASLSALERGIVEVAQPGSLVSET